MDTSIPNPGKIFRDARRRKGLTQDQAAQLIDATQPAISMFETGQKDALAKPKVAAFAEAVGLKLEDLPATASPSRIVPLGLKFCANEGCLSHVRCVIDDTPRLLPSMVRTRLSEETRCSYCGTTLLARCDACGAFPTEGVFCPECGNPYLDFRDENIGDPHAWASKGQQDLERILTLSATRQYHIPIDAGSKGHARPHRAKGKTE